LDFLYLKKNTCIVLASFLCWKKIKSTHDVMQVTYLVNKKLKGEGVLLYPPHKTLFTFLSFLFFFLIYVFFSISSSISSLKKTKRRGGFRRFYYTSLQNTIHLIYFPLFFFLIYVFVFNFNFIFNIRFIENWFL